jgi:hypothetical protein
VSQLAPQEFRDQFTKQVLSQLNVKVEEHDSDISVEGALGLWLKKGCLGENREAFMQVPNSREFAHIHPGTPLHLSPSPVPLPPLLVL